MFKKGHNLLEGEIINIANTLGPPDYRKIYGISVPIFADGTRIYTVYGIHYQLIIHQNADVEVVYEIDDQND